MLRNFSSSALGKVQKNGGLSVELSIFSPPSQTHTATTHISLQPKVSILGSTSSSDVTSTPTHRSGGEEKLTVYRQARPVIKDHARKASIMCYFELVTYHCQHQVHRRCSYCHFARNNENHVCVIGNGNSSRDSSRTSSTLSTSSAEGLAAMGAIACFFPRAALRLSERHAMG